MTETNKYEETLNNLINSLNGKKSKESAELFKNSLKVLKNDFGKSISTKFLRGLMVNFAKRQKESRINYLLKKSGLVTEDKTRFNFKGWVLNKYSVDVVDYSRNKNNEVFIKDIQTAQIGKLFYIDKLETLKFITP